MPSVCNYEGSDYRTRFWENQGRDYEDQVERIALRRLMPPTGKTLLDVGAGFGRYADEFAGYERVVLLDYSASLLREARERLGDDPRFKYVAANWYKMPFVNGLFQTFVQLRTIHHAADVPALFDELARIAQPNGTYVLEFANKRNLKAMGRYLLRKQSWSPYDTEPIEFVELNFDFHPKYIREQLRAAQFEPGKTIPVSHFRLGVLKRTVPTKLLVTADRLAQFAGSGWQFTPSVFVRSVTPTRGSFALADQFFACPECKAPLKEEGDQLPCACGCVWGIEEGVYNFKEPIAR